MTLILHGPVTACVCCSEHMMNPGSCHYTVSPCIMNVLIIGSSFAQHASKQGRGCGCSLAHTQSNRCWFNLHYAAGLTGA